MASADLRRELTCSVCFSIYTDPVTLSCGHNFCRRCINKIWDNQDEGEYSCPECQQRFRRRPELKQSLRLRNIAETFQTTELSKETGIFRTHPLAKLMLQNDAYEMKEKQRRDLQEVLRTKRQNIIKRVQSLQEHRRRVQEKAVGVTEGLTTQIRDIRKQLQDLEKRVLSDITRQQEQVLLTISKVIQQLEKEKDELTRKICDIDELCHRPYLLTILQEQESHMSYLFGARPRKRDNEVTQTDDNQVPAGGDLDEGLISVTLYRGLADIVTDVKRKLYVQVTSDILLDINTAGNKVIVSGDLKSATSSHLNTESTPRIRSRKPFHMDDYERSWMHPKEMLFNRELMEPRAHRFKSRYDLNKQQTASKSYLHTFASSDDDDDDDDDDELTFELGMLSFSEIKQSSKNKKINKGFSISQRKRFTDHPQVLSIRSFSSGRHYWEVQMSKAGHWCVGVCYTSMGRGGDESVIGENNKSWGLYGDNKDLSVRHNSIYTSLRPPLSCDTVGILLDYEAGRLTFYELCNPIRHLHTFSATFTEPLHAAFCVRGNGAFWVTDDGTWVRIM